MAFLLDFGYDDQKACALEGCGITTGVLELKCLEPDGYGQERTN